MSYFGSEECSPNLTSYLLLLTYPCVVFCVTSPWGHTRIVPSHVTYRKRALGEHVVYVDQACPLCMWAEQIWVCLEIRDLPEWWFEFGFSFR